MSNLLDAYGAAVRALRLGNKPCAIVLLNCAVYDAHAIGRADLAARIKHAIELITKA